MIEAIKAQIKAIDEKLADQSDLSENEVADLEVQHHNLMEMLIQVA